MSTDTGGRPTHRLLPRHLTPEQVRSARFEHPPFGRRGLDEPQVLAYLHQLADELAGRDAEIARLGSENAQLKHALREWHRQLVGYDAAELIARTQRQVEAQISQAESYSRAREEQAAQLYDEIVAEARQRAQEEARRVPRRRRGPRTDPAAAPQGHGDGDGHSAGRDAAGGGRGGGDVDPEWLDRQRVYAHALLQALDAMAAQVDATRHAFSFEVGQLDGIVGVPPLPPLGPSHATPPPAAAPVSPHQASDPGPPFPSAQPHRPAPPTDVTPPAAPDEIEITGAVEPLPPQTPDPPSGDDTT